MHERCFVLVSLLQAWIAAASFWAWVSLLAGITT
jgi:hypothetical protein